MHLLEERPVLSVGPVCGAMFALLKRNDMPQAAWRVLACVCAILSSSWTTTRTRNRRPARAAPEDRLDSWKEIAAYLGRGIRTVQRWEREEGLPVHRLAHEKRGSIYARREELAAWWESRRLTLAAPV